MGKATALLLAEHGYTVYAGTRDSSEELMKEAEQRGVGINTVTLDVQDTASIRKAVQHVMEKEGRIDALVNNAGFGLLATLEEGTDRSEEHTSELQSRPHLVCRLLL